jgi:hypothetical protein
MKTLFTFLVFIFLLTTVQAQEIEATLGGSTTSEGFSVIDVNEGLVLFRVNGLGNVGIGTSSPLGKLDIRGNSTDEGVVIHLGNSDGSHQVNIFSGRENDPNPFIQWQEGDPFRFATSQGGWNELMRIQSNGNVGIGTVNPNSKLEVAGTIHSTSGGVKFPDGSVQSTAASTTGNHYIGESYGGGIVFWVDATGQHGLIAATSDQSTEIQWYNGTNRVTNATGDGVGAGKMNTSVIIAMQTNDNVAGSFAALLCANLVITSGGVDYGDWYLPSKYELILMYLQKATIGNFTSNWYWSSTEYSSSSSAWNQSFSGGNQSYPSKEFAYKVRAVRAF